MNQVLGAYEAKDVIMKKYLDKVLSLISEFSEFCIDQVPRSQNKRALDLSKLASSAYSHLTKKVLVSVLPTRSIERLEVHTVEEDAECWMTSIVRYLSSAKLPEDKNKAPKAVTAYLLLFGRIFKTLTGDLPNPLLPSCSLPISVL